MSMPDPELRHAVETFLYREARLLDEARWEDWLALFAEDGFYWIPARPDQTDPLGEISVVYEDPSVLRLRVRRLMHPHAWTLQPRPRTAHVIGNVTLENGDASGGQAESPVAPAKGDVAVSSMVTIAEFRGSSGSRGTGPGGGGADRRLYAGRQTHWLRPDESAEGGFRIALKRLDLIDCDDAQGPINVIL